MEWHGKFFIEIEVALIVKERSNSRKSSSSAVSLFSRANLSRLRSPHIAVSWSVAFKTQYMSENNVHNHDNPFNEECNSD